MKRIFMLLVAIASLMGAQAQDIFNHLGVGLGVGLNGVSVDVAMPITKFVTVRPGFNYFPSFKVNTDIDIDAPDQTPGYTIPSSIEVQGKPNLITGMVLFDVHPIPMIDLRLTVGAYFGKSNIIDVYNRYPGALKEVTDWNNEHPDNLIGAELGEYLLRPDAQGNVNAQIKTHGFRPYIGIGYGRAIPKKLINFSFDIGCQFWGSPKIYCNGEQLREDKVGEGDEGGIIKTISKISVYPSINLRIGFRAF